MLTFDGLSHGSWVTNWHLFLAERKYKKSEKVEKIFIPLTSNHVRHTSSTHCLAAPMRLAGVLILSLLFMVLRACCACPLNNIMDGTHCFFNGSMWPILIPVYTLFSSCWLRLNFCSVVALEPSMFPTALDHCVDTLSNYGSRREPCRTCAVIV
jgi:hypothetical protein